jgi:isoquinoline 1-oxidoreductase beta subunit
MPQVEMGQGVYTSIAMILAEELDADFAQVALEHAPPSDKLYGNPDVRHSGHRQFQFGPRVLEAAAQGGAGRARHAGSGRRASNGRSIPRKLHHRQQRGHARGERAQAFLWRAGARGEQLKPPPKDPPLKDPKDFVLIGKPLKRLDTPDKVNGKAVYGIDAMLPGMKFATLRPVRCSAARSPRSTTAPPRRFPACEGRRAGRFRRRGRRSHVGGQEGPEPRW